MAVKIKPIQLPFKDQMVNERGEITPTWRNALIDLQTSLNELIRRANA